jgi:hypothetical protein
MVRRRRRTNSLFHRAAHPTELVVDTTWPRLSLLPPDKSLRGPTIALNRIGHQRRPARRPSYYTFVAIATVLARA